MCLCEEKTFQILIIEKSERFLFYFIIYKIDKEYYEFKTYDFFGLFGFWFKTTQNHCSKKKFNFDLGSSPLV